MSIIIHSLTYQPARSEYKIPYRFNRLPVNSLTLIAGHGIERDFKAGRNPSRHINIMSYNTVQLLNEEGYKTKPGELGEQIVVRGFDVLLAGRGTRLLLGEEAIIELNAPRTPCIWFEQIQGLSHENVVNRLGMMATVIRSGVIRIRDAVTLLQARDLQENVMGTDNSVPLNNA